MNKAYLISVSTALAIGISGTFAVNALIAQAAVPTKHSETVSKILPTGAQNSLENIISQQACSEINAKHGVGTCIVNSQTESACFYWQPANGGGIDVFMKVKFGLGGTFTPSVPQ